ncbi:anti-sigma B factor antagonist [Lachnospiraceae bacterium XBB2008]|nr:anti-sigma B factor antagonist [Lachnospiraceae bacterium XBB2008]
MNVKKTKDGDVLTVAIEGSLDIKTSPQLKEALKGELENVSSLIFDLADCNYTSSAGLRVILESYQILSERDGGLSIINANSVLYDTLKLSGFTDFIDIKRAE